MIDGSPRAVVRPLSVARHPIYSIFLPIPIVCFVGALLTDLAYLSSPDMMWVDFSSWLLLAGLIGGAVAGLILVIELVRGAVRRGPLFIHFLLAAAAWVVEVFNSFVHARDGWTAVAGTGIVLSFIAVLLSLLAGWFWQSAAHIDGDAA